MSDSGRDDGLQGRHPVTVAFDRYRDLHQAAFAGSPSERYLANRLQEAFQEGWIACERRVRAALEGRNL
jgi:hypothetical protein